MNKSKHTATVMGYLAMTVAVLIWGFSFVVTKIALNSNISPMLVTTFSYIFAALSGLPILLKKRKMLKEEGILKKGAILGGCLFIARFLQATGCNYSTAGKNAFITAVYVVLTPIFMWLIYKKKITVKSMVVAVMAMIGIGIISLNEEFTGINIGDVITLVAAVGFAVQITLNGRFAAEHDPVLIGVLQVDFAAVFAVISWAIYQPLTGDTFSLAVWTPETLGCVLYSGVLGVSLGFILQTLGQKYVEQSKAAVILSMESVSGAACSIIFLHEVFDIRMLIGCAIIFIALMANVFWKEQR